MLMDETVAPVPVTKELKGGDVVHVCGIPVRLSHDVAVITTEWNWNLIAYHREMEAEADEKLASGELPRLQEKRDGFELNDRVLVLDAALCDKRPALMGVIDAMAEGDYVRVCISGWFTPKRWVWPHKNQIRRVTCESKRGALWFYR